MGRLAIRRLTYWGDRYNYISPWLKDGLQIIQASNGGGKTTFADLICYGLGLYVKQFDTKEKRQIHEEIHGDTNNYVMLDVLISDANYQLTRYFSRNNNNQVFIKSENGIEGQFPINRTQYNANQTIFSDWLLDKLGIKVCEIFVGTRKFKINFSDLFRLIYHDQNTPPDKIYKEHRMDGNFMSDSSMIRKVIFELLIGYQFSEYYGLIGKSNQAERLRDSAKETLGNFSTIAENMGFNLTTVSVEQLFKQLDDVKRQREKLDISRNAMKAKPISTKRFPDEMQKRRMEIVEVERKMTEVQSRRHAVIREAYRLAQLKEDIILEVTQIQKIILSHEELNLFSPNTCPICLREVKREQHHCICGASIDETQYEKFFYSSDEYLDILKSKQKSVETVDVAVKSCQDELSDLNTKKTKLQLERERIDKYMNEIKDSDGFNESYVEMDELNDKLLEVKEVIHDLEHKEQLIRQYNVLSQNYEGYSAEYKSLTVQISSLEGDVHRLIEKRAAEFNKIYNQLMQQADSDVHSAEIDDNYMPTINERQYREPSSHVPKRMMYFLTLLKMAIDYKTVPFPKFLLIDTPENLGIDKDKLDLCFLPIANVLQGKSEGQVILTTGIGKYPDGFMQYVVETITDDQKLLKLRS